MGKRQKLDPSVHDEGSYRRGTNYYLKVPTLTIGLAVAKALRREVLRGRPYHRSIARSFRSTGDSTPMDIEFKERSGNSLFNLKPGVVHDITRNSQ